MHTYVLAKYVACVPVGFTQTLSCPTVDLPFFINHLQFIIDQRNASVDMQVCFLSDIKSLYVSICPVTNISSTVSPIGMKFCIMVDDDPRQKVFPLGVPPRCPKMPNFDREYLENGKSQVYISNVA